MGLHNPPHPGGIIRDQCLAPLGSPSHGLPRSWISATVPLSIGQRTQGNLTGDGGTAGEVVWLNPGDLAGGGRKPMTSGRRVTLAVTGPATQVCTWSAAACKPYPVRHREGMGDTGFEPVTPPMSTVCSTPELIAP